jgi:hypothetical protein
MNQLKENAGEKWKKKGARIEIQPRFNPIFYEKPNVRGNRKMFGCSRVGNNQIRRFFERYELPFPPIYKLVSP